MGTIPGPPARRCAASGARSVAAWVLADHLVVLGDGDDREGGLAGVVRSASSTARAAHYLSRVIGLALASSVKVPPYQSHQVDRA